MRKVKKTINRQRQATMKNWSKCLVHHAQSQLEWILLHKRESKLAMYEINRITSAIVILEKVKKTWH